MAQSGADTVSSLQLAAIHGLRTTDNSTSGQGGKAVLVFGIAVRGERRARSILSAEWDKVKDS